MKISASLIVALCAAKNIGKESNKKKCEEDGNCPKKETRMLGAVEAICPSTHPYMFYTGYNCCSEKPSHPTSSSCSGSAIGCPTYKEMHGYKKCVDNDQITVTQTGESGTIKMGVYGHDQLNKWAIESDCDYVRVISSVFETEPLYDYLDIDGKKYSGYNGIDHTICGPNGELIFKSDGSNSYGFYDGFELNWECHVGEAEACAALKGTSGTIKMEGYVDYEEGEWKVESDCESVRIVSRSFDTEPSSDVVYIDGDKYHGKLDNSIDQIVPGSFEISFDANYDNSDFGGFELFWECAKTEVETTQCPSTHPYIYYDGKFCCQVNPLESVGSIACPAYVDCPDSGKTCTDFHVTQTGASGTIEIDGYINDQENAWKIKSDCEQIRIVSALFDTEQSYDYLDIEGTSFSGSSQINHIICNSDAHVVFTADEGKFAYDGFELNWECETEAEECEPTTCPTTHPWAYYNGSHCCATAREKVHAPHGASCDGSAIGLTSSCCENDSAKLCPSPPCTNNAETPAYKPCPSDKCWTFDESSNECNMLAECSSLSCGATAFVINFVPELFGLTDAQTDVKFAAGYADSPPTRYPDPTVSLWKVISPLGSNGMIYTIDSDANEITFEVQISLDGSGETSLGAKSIVKKTGAEVKFQCTYPMTVELTSEIFTVEEVTVTDASVSTGTLDGGFVMTLNNDESADILLGAILPVSITWAASELGFFTFYPVVCTVTHGATEIAIVKDGCFSDEIGVLAGTPDGDLKMVDFSFRVFKGFEEEGTDQTMACSIQICHEDTCDKPTEDSQCPSTADDVFYKYTVVGAL